MREIQSLERVSLREAWPNEAQDFTPWLAENIDRLGAGLDLRLKGVQKEVTLPRAGRVDIRAQQAETDATVVIENPLGDSDDSHCLRLLGYAANAEANILVWVARAFTSYHKSILEWLNDADTIHVYAVTVRAYRVGEALAADFQTVVEPQSQSGPSRPAKKNSNTLYAEFYRPLVARLRQNGVQPVGRGGWRGRWRSFQSGHPGAVYALGLSGGKAKVFLSFRGAGHEQRFQALLQHQEEINGKVKGAVWHDADQGSWKSTVLLEGDGPLDLTGPEEELETVRRWMAASMLSLRNAVQPYLEEVLHDEDADPGEVVGAG